MKLNEPTNSFSESIDSCCEGITGNRSLLDKVTQGKQILERNGSNYIINAATGELYTIQATTHNRDEDPIVTARLTKSELIKLYETYFRNSDKPGRVIYDELLAAANDNCPFCGGIGRPKNLDHYLPKAHFPQFSIFPYNLIPSCRDCNMDGKGQIYATTQGEQVIQPYLDNARFFDEQWIYATYTQNADNSEGDIEYFVRAPNDWSEQDKARVQSHFDDFELAVRFSKEAGARIVTLKPQIDSLIRIGLSINQIREAIIQPGIESTPFINHWERVMYLAILDYL